MKQTPVEWLYERLERMIPRSALYDIDKREYFKQAKEMEKEQEQDKKLYSEEDLDMFRKFMIQEQNFSKSCLDVFIEQFKKK